MNNNQVTEIDEHPSITAQLRYLVMKAFATYESKLTTTEIVEKVVDGISDAQKNAMPDIESGITAYVKNLFSQENSNSTSKVFKVLPVAEGTKQNDTDLIVMRDISFQDYFEEVLNQLADCFELNFDTSYRDGIEEGKHISKPEILQNWFRGNYDKLDTFLNCMLSSPMRKALIQDIARYIEQQSFSPDLQLRMLIAKYCFEHKNERIVLEKRKDDIFPCVNITEDFKKYEERWNALTFNEEDFSKAIDRAFQQFATFRITRNRNRRIEQNPLAAYMLSDLYAKSRDRNIHQGNLYFIYKELLKDWEKDNEEVIENIKEKLENEFEKRNPPVTDDTSNQEKEDRNKAKKKYVNRYLQHNIQNCYLRDGLIDQTNDEDRWRALFEVDNLDKIDFSVVIPVIWKYIKTEEIFHIDHLLQHCEIGGWRPTDQIVDYYAMHCEHLDDIYDIYNSGLPDRDAIGILFDEEDLDDMLSPVKIEKARPITARYVENGLPVYNAEGIGILYAVRVKSLETMQESVRFAMKDATHSELLPISMTMGAKNGILQLKNIGIGVDSHNLPDIVRAITNGYQEMPVYVSSDHLGWSGKNAFISSKYHGIQDAELFDDSFCLSKHGDLNEWIKICNRVIKGKPIAQIVLCSAFASAVIGALHMRSLLINLCGKPATGKSTFEEFCTSIWSYPKDTKVYTTFDGTDYALVSRLNNNLGISFVLDDTSKGNLKDYSQLIYQLSDGVSRDRLGKGNVLEESKHWATSIVLSSENSIFSQCNPHTTGVLRRLIEFEIEQGTLIEDAKSARETSRIIAHNYGLAGNAFLQFLFENGLQYDLVKMYEKTCESMSAQIAAVQNKNNSGKTAYNQLEGIYNAVAEHIAVLVVTKRLLEGAFKNFPIVFDSLTDEKIIEEVLGSLKNAQEHLYEAYGYSNNVLEAFGKKVIELSKDKSKEDECFEENKYYYVSSLIMQEIADANGVDKRELLSILKDTGVLCREVTKSPDNKKPVVRNSVVKRKNDRTIRFYKLDGSSDLFKSLPENTSNPDSSNNTANLEAAAAKANGVDHAKQ